MSPMKKGTKLTDNPRNRRFEIRLTEAEEKEIRDSADKCKMSKSAILLQGLRLVELQNSNREFRDLSDYLILHELEKKEPINEKEKKEILSYLGLLGKKYQ